MKLGKSVIHVHYDLGTYEMKLLSVPEKSSTYFDSYHLNVSISKLVGQFSTLTVI